MYLGTGQKHIFFNISNINALQTVSSELIWVGWGDKNGNES